MKRSFVLRAGARLVVMLAAFAASSAAHAVRELTGTTPGGAAFVIAVPDGWQPGGPLVFINRGYSYDVVASPDLGPIAELQLSQGYALAASGFRQRGWALFDALDDNAELLARFRASFGEPGALYAAGGSMGGLISLKQAEDPRFAAKTKGVLALCAPSLGSRTWDYAFDIRMIYDRVCDGVGGGELPTGPAPLSYALHPDDLPDSLDLDAFPPDSDLVRALLRVTQCTGLFLPEDFRSSSQRARLATLKEKSGLTDEDFLATNLGYSVYALSELVRAPDKLAGGGAFDNRRVTYGDAAFDAGVARYAADPFAALELRAASDLRGAGSARILALTTTGDQLVVPQHQLSLPSVYLAPRLASAFVAETSPSHCEFTTPELTAGWNALTAWTGGGAAPDAIALQQRCRDTGAASADCRLTSQVPALPVQLRARDWSVPYGISGSWFDPARSGEGLVVEAPRVRGENVLVSWYTYNAAGAAGGDQLWIVGAGEQYENTVRVRDAYIARGPRFLSGGAVQLERWGSLDIAFDSVTDGADGTGIGGATLRWHGPTAFGDGERTMARATYLGEMPGTPPSFAPLPVHRSGTYTIDGHDGHGLVLQQDIQADATKRSFLTWYTFDANGNPVWLTGAVIGSDALTFQMFATRGTRFGPAFDPDDVVRVPWGTVTLTPSGCGPASLSSITWQAIDPAFGSGTRALTRLSDPRGALALPGPVCE